MTVKKLNVIPKDYQTFSDHYDKVFAARAHLGNAAQFGFDLPREGEYFSANDVERRIANNMRNGFDPKQAYNPMNDFDPRYTGPNQRRNAPDMPYQENELRHDDPRYAARMRSKTPRPGF